MLSFSAQSESSLSALGKLNPGGVRWKPFPGFPLFLTVTDVNWVKRNNLLDGVTNACVSLSRPDFCFVLSGESSPTRREAVKRRTAEYLMRAESICSLRVTAQLDTGPQVCWLQLCVL